MDFFADLLIATGALGVAIFCFVLSRRLKALGRLDSGIGGAIAVLAKQVDDLTRALKAAQATARDSATKLEDQTRRADAACRQLELLMASLHDLPSPEAVRKTKPVARAPDPEATFPTARPLARWNTNRLRPEVAEEDDILDAARKIPVATRDESDDAPARALRFDPVEPATPRPRSRIVRRRRKISACA